MCWGRMGIGMPEDRWRRAPTSEAMARILWGQSWRSLRACQDLFYFVGVFAGEWSSCVRKDRPIMERRLEPMAPEDETEWPAPMTLESKWPSQTRLRVSLSLPSCPLLHLCMANLSLSCIKVMCTGIYLSPSKQTSIICALVLNLCEEGTVTHSSILAWRIPWMEEPQRVEESCTWMSDWACMHSTSIGY